MDLHLKNLLDRFQEQFGSGPGLGPGSGACLMKVEGINDNIVRSLFRAAASLYRTDPWKRFRPGHLFKIRVGKDSDWSGNKQPFPCVQFIGGDGGDLGFQMFRSEGDAKKMTGSRETIRIPNVEIARVTYEAESLMFPSNKRMIKALSLEVSGTDHFPVIDVAKCTSSGNLRFRNPNSEELRFVYAFMKAISLVHPLLQLEKQSSAKFSTLGYFEPFIETVDVQWPPDMAKGHDLVAVTISHPPGQGFEEKTSSTASSTPTKYSDPTKDEFFGSSIIPSSSSLSRQCAMCAKECNWEQILCCERCRAVLYCTPICQKQHWKETHKTVCGLYRAMMEREEELTMKIFHFPCTADLPCKWLETLGIHQKGMWRRKCSCYSHCPFGLLPTKGGLWDSWGGLDDMDYPKDSSLHSHQTSVSSPILLSGWPEYYNLRGLPLSSPVADILSHPLTVYYILTTLSITTKTLLQKGKEVILHYLGPEGELDWMPAFAEIGHLLNGLGNVQIVMVGPEVPTNLSGTTSGISSRVRVNLIRGLYQEEASYLPSPHVILGLNCGLDQYPSWGGALDLIKSIGVPAFFTDLSEILCSNLKQGIRGSGLHITHPVTPNPFRSPVRNHGVSDNLPCFSNGFILGVNT